MKTTVLFDLGGTLVEYYSRSEFPGLLRQAIAGAQECLEQAGLPSEPMEALWPRVAAEDHEADDYRVRPLEQRLARIFQLEEDASAAPLLEAMGRRFMEPIFSRAHCYDDTRPALVELRAGGYRLAIVSNAAWGSPAHFWREELARHGLDQLVDLAVFCRDVGWRKPAAPIFHYTMEKLHARPAECLFVGDDPRWDIAGPQALGITAVLIDRKGSTAQVAAARVHTLPEFLAWLKANATG